MQINGSHSTKIAIWVGGKHSNARSKPTFHKLVVANLPNNPPRWPEVEEVVKTHLSLCLQGQRQGLFERMGEWIERIGWPRFFEMTGFAFTKHHLDTGVGARKTMNQSAHVHFYAATPLVREGRFSLTLPIHSERSRCVFQSL